MARTGDSCQQDIALSRVDRPVTSVNGLDAMAAVQHDAAQTEALMSGPNVGRLARGERMASPPV